MSASNGQQFDPIAAAATAGINAADRGLASVAQNLNAPELPAQGQAVQSANQVINSVGQLSPANVLARGSLPSLPGQGGQGQGIPTPDQVLQGQNGLPTPDELVQGQGPLPSLQSVFPFLQGGNGGMPQPPMPGNGNGGGGGNGGNGGGGGSSASRTRRTNPNDLQPSG